MPCCTRISVALIFDSCHAFYPATLALRSHGAPYIMPADEPRLFAIFQPGFFSGPGEKGPPGTTRRPSQTHDWDSIAEPNPTNGRAAPTSALAITPRSTAIPMSTAVPAPVIAAMDTAPASAGRRLGQWPQRAATAAIQESFPRIDFPSVLCEQCDRLELNAERQCDDAHGH
jgi:hypothetical protein